MKYYHKHPEFAEALATRAERYNKCIAELMELKAEGKVFVFTPKTTFGVGRTEGDPAKLKRLYDYGYAHAKAAACMTFYYLIPTCKDIFSDRPLPILRGRSRNHKAFSASPKILPQRRFFTSRPAAGYKGRAYKAFRRA